MTTPSLALFAMRSGRAFGERVAAHLRVPLAEHEERDFEWGHHKARPLVSVRGRDVYVVQSLHGDAEQSVNDKLCRLLLFLGALRDAAADRVTAVVPFLCYSRKERRTQPRDPVATRTVARLFEAVDVDCVVTLEVHDLAAFQNAFRCRTEHLTAHALFAERLAGDLRGEEVVVASPDVGGIKRAERYRQALARRLEAEPGSAFVDKRRSGGVVTGEAVVGEVRGRTVLFVDDMICAGTTLARAAEACRKAGARRVLAAAAHAAFVPEAGTALADAPLDRLYVLDHIPPTPLGDSPVAGRIVALDAARLIAEAVWRMHVGDSLVDLLEGATDPPARGTRARAGASARDRARRGR